MHNTIITLHHGRTHYILSIIIILASAYSDKVELVAGYGVWLTVRQLDEAVAASNGKATKLSHALLTVFFETHTLAQSSARLTPE